MRATPLVANLWHGDATEIPIPVTVTFTVTVTATDPAKYHQRDKLSRPRAQDPCKYDCEHEKEGGGGFTLALFRLGSPLAAT